MIGTITRTLTSISSRLYLTLAVVLATVPFLNLRVLRMAGDEKVYVSQAIEMARGGRWFVQTLADEPNYFKGPLHYILVRIGMLVFGDSLIAGVWMNTLFAVLLALAAYKIAKRFLDEERSLLAGLACGLNVGIFSHILASQMEVELSAVYTIALLMLIRNDSDKIGFKADLPFWIATGIAGWIKSPAHCALIGAGGILFWIADGSILKRIKNAGTYLAGICGVLVCLIGYAPYLLYDYKNFYETYVMRENVVKADNNRHWSYVIAPLLHFALPWTLLALAGMIGALKSQSRRLAKLGLAYALPTILFWATFRYKGQNYNLPALSALLIASIAAIPSGKIPRWVFSSLGAIGMLTLLAMFAVISNFMPLPEWWSLGWMIGGFAGIFIFASIFLFSTDMRTLGIGAVCFFIGFGSFITPIGKREMTDIKTFIGGNLDVVLHYDDLDPSIWNEWGLLQLTLGKSVYVVHTEAQLQDALKPGHAILTPNEAGLERIKKAWAETHNPGGMVEINKVGKTEQIKESGYVVQEWTRWMTKGKNAEGKHMWQVAWDERDLTKLERKFYIFWIPNNTQASNTDSVKK